MTPQVPKETSFDGGKSRLTFSSDGPCFTDTSLNVLHWFGFLLLYAPTHLLQDHGLIL